MGAKTHVSKISGFHGTGDTRANYAPGLQDIFLLLVLCEPMNIGSLFRLTEATSCLDLLTAFADISSSPDCVCPRFGPQTFVKSSRHPILDKMNFPHR